MLFCSYILIINRLYCLEETNGNVSNISSEDTLSENPGAISAILQIIHTTDTNHKISMTTKIGLIRHFTLKSNLTNSNKSTITGKKTKSRTAIAAKPERAKPPNAQIGTVDNAATP